MLIASLRSMNSGWSRFLKTRLWISFDFFQKTFFPRIWSAKFRVRLICGCGLSAGFYGIHIKNNKTGHNQISPFSTARVCRIDQMHRLFTWNYSLLNIYKFVIKECFTCVHPTWKLWRFYKNTLKWIEENKHGCYFLGLMQATHHISEKNVNESCSIATEQKWI